MKVESHSIREIDKTIDKLAEKSDEEIIYKLYRMYDQIIEFMENPTEFEGFSEVE